VRQDEEPRLDDEKRLSALQGKRLQHRLWGYLRMTGPGYMQSAITSGHLAATAVRQCPSLSGRGRAGLELANALW
jgi:hypothetical protein